MKMLDHAISAKGKKEWRENWPVVVTAMVGFALSVIHLYSLGVMIKPLERAFGWSRTEISSGLLIVSVVVFPLAPLMGRAIDRIGPRRIALFGGTFYCASIATLSLAQQPIWTWWVLWLLVAFGNVFLTPTIWIAAISRLFDASRGLALAVMMSAGGVMSFGGPMLTNALINHFGWRMAYVLLGGMAAAIMLPLVYLFFFSTKDATMAEAKTKSSSAIAAMTGLSIPEALRSFAFLRLAATSFLMSVMTMALLVNLVPILSSMDLDEASVPAIAGIVGITHFLGRLVGGFLLDHLNARVVGAVIVLLPTITCVMLITSGGSAIFAAIAVLAFGLTVGAEMDVIAYLAGRFVGMRNFGALFGGIIALLTVGNGLGPTMASFIYDLTKSYEMVLWIVFFLSLISSLMLLTLGDYPTFGKEAQEKQRDPVLVG